MIHPSLHRYITILDNPEAFLTSLKKPLPTTVWLNPLKATSSQLEQSLATVGWKWSGVPWYPGGYRINATRAGGSLAFSCGWYGIQEEIAWSAVQAMDPQPGDRVLDLCAAPGGKTAQLALAIGPTGTVMANDRALPRLSSLVTTITRLGLTNVVTSQVDGRLFQAQPHSFDRVLVDVPCSGEGTLRKKLGRRSLAQENWNERHSHRLTSIQRQLLDRALDLVKPGGIVVYSTCTFAPEENEAVIDAVVGDRGIIEPYSLPGLRAAAGLCQWQNQTFRQDSQYAQRYWPHLNDTGGFFVARIRRTDTKLKDSAEQFVCQTPSCKRLDETDAQTVFDWMGDRFGLNAEIFEPYTLWETGKEKIWIADQSCTTLLSSVSEPTETIGIPLVRRTPHSFKPTTAGLQRFAAQAQNQTITLDIHQCQSFMKGNPQKVQLVSLAINDQKADSAKLTGKKNLTGFTHVRYGPYELGCGRLKNGILHSEIPKALRL